MFFQSYFVSPTYMDESSPAQFISSLEPDANFLDRDHLSRPWLFPGPTFSVLTPQKQDLFMELCLYMYRPCPDNLCLSTICECLVKFPFSSTLLFSGPNSLSRFRPCKSGLIKMITGSLESSAFNLRRSHCRILSPSQPAGIDFFVGSHLLASTDKTSTQPNSLQFTQSLLSQSFH